MLLFWYNKNVLYLCITKKEIIITIKTEIMKTYDVHFNDCENSNNKGWSATLQECIDYIEINNGTNNSYFEDYKGGIVSVVCNETEETVFETEVN